MKRIVTVLLIISIVVSLCGCGSNLSTEEKYVCQDVEQLHSLKNESKLTISGDILLVSYENSDGDTTYISYINTTGEIVEKNGLDWADGTSIFRNHTYLGDYSETDELKKNDFASEEDYFVAWAMRRLFAEARLYLAEWCFAVHAGGETNYTNSDGVQFTLISGNAIAKATKSNFID